MDKKQGSGKKAQELEPRSASADAAPGNPAEPGSSSETVPTIIAGEGAIPAVLVDPADLPETLADPHGTIPVVAAALPEDGSATDLDIKAPEMERSLDRAKENLLAYIAERSPNFNSDLIQRAID